MQRRLALKGLTLTGVTSGLSLGLASGLAASPRSAQANTGLSARSNLPHGDWRPLGRGTLRVFGFQIYDAHLWAAPGFKPDVWSSSALALELHYLRSFKAEAIAERSLQEMRRVGDFSSTQAQRWQAALQAALPDVAAGDRVLGVHLPGTGAEFRRGSQVTGRVDDASFSTLFFGIWLSPRTSAPELRQALLTPTT